MREATVEIADIHYGDSGHLLRSFTNAKDQIAQKISELRPDRVAIVLNGDTTEGKGIYRTQYLDNSIQFGDKQVLGSAWSLHQFAQGLPAPARFILVLGHHDYSAGDNLAISVALVLNLLGSRAFYAGNRYVHEYTPGRYCLYVHGYGNNQYYAASPTTIRKTWLRACRATLYGRPIDRMVFAHTHWFSSKIPLDSEVRATVLGGWTRPPINKLNWADNRPTGAMVVCDGKENPIEPDPAIFREEMNNPDLDLENAIRYSEDLMDARNWLRQRGIIG